MNTLCIQWFILQCDIFSESMWQVDNSMYLNLFQINRVNAAPAMV